MEPGPGLPPGGQLEGVEQEPGVCTPRPELGCECVGELFAEEGSLGDQHPYQTGRCRGPGVRSPVDGTQLLEELPTLAAQGADPGRGRTAGRHSPKEAALSEEGEFDGAHQEAVHAALEVVEDHPSRDPGPPGDLLGGGWVCVAVDEVDHGFEEGEPAVLPAAPAGGRRPVPARRVHG